MKDKLTNMDFQAREIARIFEKKSRDDLICLIKPYLLKKKDLPEDKEEKRERLKNEGLPDSDIEEIMEDYPDLIIEQKKGFCLTYIIDWSEKFREADYFDYLTYKIIYDFRIEKSELYGMAIKNLSEKPIRYKNIGYLNENEFDVYYLEYESKVNPSYNVSMLLVDDVWKRFKSVVGGNYYIAPICNEFLLVIPQREIEKNKVSIKGLYRIMNTIVTKYNSIFSKIPIFYDGKMEAVDS